MSNNEKKNIISNQSISFSNDVTLTILCLPSSIKLQNQFQNSLVNN